MTTTRTPRKARKPHRCWLCGFPVHPGTTYLDTRTFDGTAWTDAEHTWCSEAAHDPMDLWRYDDEVGEAPEEFRDALVRCGVTTAEGVERWCEFGPSGGKPSSKTHDIAEVDHALA